MVFGDTITVATGANTGPEWATPPVQGVIFFIKVAAMWSADLTVWIGDFSGWSGSTGGTQLIAFAFNLSFDKPGVVFITTPPTYSHVFQNSGNGQQGKVR